MIDWHLCSPGYESLFIQLQSLNAVESMIKKFMAATEKAYRGAVAQVHIGELVRFNPKSSYVHDLKVLTSLSQCGFLCSRSCEWIHDGNFFIVICCGHPVRVILTI